MLPPITGPNVAAKTAPATASGASPKGEGVQVGRDSLRPETAPAGLRAETLRAVDPPDQSPRAEGLRTSSPGASDLTEALPAGPPPAFVETLLERQARQVFDPPPEASRDGAPDPRPTDAGAKAGFEAARNLGTPGTPPNLDLKT